MKKVIKTVCENWIMLCGIGACILFLLWIVGYFYNGLFGKNFNIDSVWTGVGVIAGTGITGFGSELARYYMDSKYNSKQGIKPDLNGNGIPDDEE